VDDDASKEALERLERIERTCARLERMVMRVTGSSHVPKGRAKVTRIRQPVDLPEGTKPEDIKWAQALFKKHQQRRFGG
jgi:hypothetical protein